MANKGKNEKVEELARQSSGAMVAQENLPAFMRGQAGMGTEQIGAQDVEIPRLKLLQALSPEVQERDLKQGQFYHTVVEEGLGPRVKVVIVYADQAFILWRPRKSGGGILARAMDGIHWVPPDVSFDVTLDDGKTKVVWKTAATVAKSGLAEWGSQDPNDPKSPPAATRMYNCVVVMPEFPEYGPAVVTLQRSAIKVARKLLGKLKLSQAPSFGLVFEMESVKDQNAQNQDFWNYRFTSVGFVEDEGEYNAYKAMYERFKAEGVRVRDIEGLQSDETGGADAGEKVTSDGTKY